MPEPIVKVDGPTMEIVWRQDPQAYWYTMPCKGCPDYCELASIDDEHKELGEIYQQEFCHGQDLIRQVALWRASYIVHRRYGETFRVEGLGIDAETALLNADAELAAKGIVESAMPGYDPP